MGYGVVNCFLDITDRRNLSLCLFTERLLFSVKGVKLCSKHFFCREQSVPFLICFAVTKSRFFGFFLAISRKKENKRKENFSLIFFYSFFCFFFLIYRQLIFVHKRFSFFYPKIFFFLSLFLLTINFSFFFFCV